MSHGIWFEIRSVAKLIQAVFLAAWQIRQERRS